MNSFELNTLKVQKGDNITQTSVVKLSKFDVRSSTIACPQRDTINRALNLQSNVRELSAQSVSCITTEQNLRLLSNSRFGFKSRCAGTSTTCTSDCLLYHKVTLQFPNSFFDLVFNELEIGSDLVYW